MALSRAQTLTVSLEEIPGVGPALAQRIRQAYGSDAAFGEACHRLDVDKLLSLEGLSERRALHLVALVRSGARADLACTDRARDVQRDLEDLLASYAQTTYGKRALRLLPVLEDANAIQSRQAAIMAMRDLAEHVDRESVRRQLARLSRLRDAPRSGSLDRLVITATEEDEMALRKRGLDRWCRIRSGREAFAEAVDRDLVLVVGSDGIPDTDSAAHVVGVDLDDPPWSFVPEAELAFVESNRANIEALASLAATLDRASVAPRILEAAETVRTERAVDVTDAANEALAAAETAFAKAVEGLSLTGSQVLDLLKGGTAQALDRARRTGTDAGRALFRERTRRDVDLFSPGVPITLDEEELSRLEQEVGQARAAEAFHRARAAAKTIAEAREALGRELSYWFEFDAEFALGCWAADADAHPARTSHRLAFRAAVNVRLAGRSDIQKIAYEVGGQQHVAVLTGANSGGKSTLLEQMAQFVLLHRWGLPVPAEEAEVPLVDSILQFGASRGLDAGAFESFLRELFPPIAAPGRKLVLLDEVESVTELEAAGRILGVFLDEVARTDSLCVLVTHLPDEVLRHTRARVRVDGIDAVGLDDRFNLVVDRQPKLDHRARSTPELILRRVHAKSAGPVKEIYARILDGWR